MRRLLLPMVCRLRGRIHYRGIVVIKVIGLLKRRPGMSVAAFREYYESRLRLIGEKYLADYACKYQRRYLNPGPDVPDHDVILEVWYPDRDAYDAANERLSVPEVAAEIAADEERLFDRTSIHFYLVEEFESDLAGSL